MYNNLKIDGYWYIATPYSKYPGGLENATQVACKETAHLISHGVNCFSPIAHTHYVALYGELDPYDHAIWLPNDQPMMNAAHGVIVMKMEGWEESYGIAEEIKYFTEAGKPIVYLEPAYESFPRS